MKTILLIAFMFLLNNIKAQQSKQDLITIVGSIQYTIETGKEYLVLIKNKDNKVKLDASGCDVKILSKDNKYYIITSNAGDVMLSVSLKGKALGPPYKFVSIKK